MYKYLPLVAFHKQHTLKVCVQQCLGNQDLALALGLLFAVYHLSRKQFHLITNKKWDVIFMNHIVPLHVALLAGNHLAQTVQEDHPASEVRQLTD